MGLYSNNDWRDYIAHKDGKYDWSSGKNPSDYNHDYYEKHKAEILANRKSKGGSVRDFGGAGVGYKAKKDNTTGENDEDYENDEDWMDELTDDEKKNIEAHNAQVDKNIAELTKTVNDYLKANEGKLSPEQIEKLKKDLATQTSIAKEQKINTKNSDDYRYVMDLRKKASSSGKSSSTSSSAKKSSKSSSNSKSSNTKPKKTQQQMKQEELKRLTEQKRKEAEEFAKQREASKKANEDNFNYDNEEARRRREEQERQKAAAKNRK